MLKKLKNSLNRLFSGSKSKSRKKANDYINLIKQLLEIKDIDFQIKDTMDDYEIIIKSKSTRKKAND